MLGQIAQLVEHRTENPGVVSSILTLPIRITNAEAESSAYLAGRTVRLSGDNPTLAQISRPRSLKVRGMELESFFIAENAEVVAGRFFAFGGGVDHIKAARFPAVVPGLAVIVNILVAPGEAASVHQFRMTSIAPDGNPFLTNVTREFGPLPLIDDCGVCPPANRFSRMSEA